MVKARWFAAALAAVPLLAPAASRADDGPHRVFPVLGPVGFGPDHARYPAADIIARCGLPVVAPVDGEILEVRRRDRWRREVDDPATRGGRSVAILGDDGVRYYVAHLAWARRGLEAGTAVRAGQSIGSVGRSGRAGTCHVHFGLSPDCERPGEWWVRRGVVAPYRYLRAWQEGRRADPSAAVRQWSVDHPDGCENPAMIGAT